MKRLNKKGNASISLALTFILALNLMFFFAQTAVEKINPNTHTSFYNYDSSMISAYDLGNYTLDEDIESDLPSGSSSVTVESGSVFTDTFATIKNWMLETTGLNYVYNIANGVPNFLKIIGLPAEIVFGLGALWHSTTIFLFIMWLKG